MIFILAIAWFVGWFFWPTITRKEFWQAVGLTLNGRGR